MLRNYLKIARVVLLRRKFFTFVSMFGISFTLVVLVLATVNGFLMLDLIYILTMGGPGRETTTISWLGFQTTFAFFKFGPGTAILYTLTGLCLLLTLIYHRLILSGFEAEG